MFATVSLILSLLVLFTALCLLKLKIPPSEDNECELQYENNAQSNYSYLNYAIGEHIEQFRYKKWVIISDSLCRDCYHVPYFHKKHNYVDDDVHSQILDNLVAR